MTQNETLIEFFQPATQLHGLLGLENDKIQNLMKIVSGKLS